ncbi:MAG: thiamine pyrophosphate-binding protein [Rhodanobacter sp.]|nr:MAG: thiamine pyrophosphate-binding protein [Rhodanobacter sp.]TAL89240.1 MAG: thiamine pyrophosphate-binding protein [Rhodanobacter sp.]TAM38657.1 MAG: thiamine pyrophosphate-binding protein [Rhodanobacter sp.]TAN23682.1 MAG: thiamine pyrophosphate-binding protein [Rhodanobacter sp.]
MKKTGAWLARHALEQLGIRYTFGIPGVQNTELYDELNNSTSITPVLVSHEGGGAFMADALSRLSDTVGTLVVVPAAGLTHAASGIGEAFLDGVPMLVICGGVRTDVPWKYQLHQMDLHQFMRGITKATYMIERHDQVVPMIFEAYRTATSGEPGPVFIELPANLQLFVGDAGELPTWQAPALPPPASAADIAAAVALLAGAKRPGLFVGWGTRDCLAELTALAEHLQAPVATTLQGFSMFPASHPLHAGFSFGPSAVPAARHAFADRDVLLAIGTRFAEIATGSFGVSVPERLIHLDINPQVFNANYPAKVAIAGDARVLLPQLLEALRAAMPAAPVNQALQRRIAADKAAYRQSWYDHDSQGRVNPARFFDALRAASPAEAVTVVDDGNHTYLTAELLPILSARSAIVPTDFNAMGYSVPAAIGAKLARPEVPVNCIVGDGCFRMTCMEIITATQNRLGVVYYVFCDGELSQIAQTQEIPYNRKPCTILAPVQLDGVAHAVGAAYFRIASDAGLQDQMAAANAVAAQGQPVIVEVRIDYSKRTAFTEGVVKTNFKRFSLSEKVRAVTRALVRKITD